MGGTQKTAGGGVGTCAGAATQARTRARACAWLDLRLSQTGEACSARIGRDDIALLEMEPDGLLECSTGFASPIREVEDLAEIGTRFGVRDEEVAAFGNSERLLSETLCCRLLTPPSKDLRASRPPEDLGMNVVRARRPLTLFRQSFRFVVSALQVDGVRQRVRDGREMTCLADAFEGVVCGAQLGLCRGRITMQDEDERVPEARDPDPLLSVVHRTACAIDQVFGFAGPSLHGKERSCSARDLGRKPEVVPVSAE
jgi:hypothetical protein